LYGYNNGLSILVLYSFNQIPHLRLFFKNAHMKLIKHTGLVSFIH